MQANQKLELDESTPIGGWLDIMKRQFLLTIAISGLLFCGNLFSMTTVPTAFSGLANSDSEADPAMLVALYQTNKTALIANTEPEMRMILSEQTPDQAITNDLNSRITPPVTMAKIEAALESFLEENPAQGAAAVVAALAMANDLSPSLTQQISLIRAAVGALSRTGTEVGLEQMAIVVGYGGQIAGEENSVNVIAALRQVAITNYPEGDPISKSVTVDAALVAWLVLKPVTGGEQFWASMSAEADGITMETALLTRQWDVERETALLAYQAGAGGIGMGSNPFGSAGALDSPDNPGALRDPSGPLFEEDEEEFLPPTPDSSPSPSPSPTPTPTPAPTPTPPAS